MPKGATKKAPAAETPKVVTLPPPGTPHVSVRYEEAFPRSEGPPPVGNHQSRSILAPSGHMVTMTMDAGAFRAVWELVEATAKARWEVRNSMPSAGAYVRAVEAFRKGWKDSPPAA